MCDINYENMKVEEKRVSHLIDELNAFDGTVISNARIKGTVLLNGKGIVINNKFN